MNMDEYKIEKLEKEKNATIITVQEGQVQDFLPEKAHCKWGDITEECYNIYAESDDKTIKLSKICVKPKGGVVHPASILGRFHKRYGFFPTMAKTLKFVLNEETQKYDWLL